MNSKQIPTSHNRWLLPDGIAEQLPPRAWGVETLRRRLLDYYKSWGYQLVCPPIIEYLSALLTGTAKDLALETFKLTDQMTGKLLGIRADITPQVARIDSHCMKNTDVARFCYQGQVLKTKPIDHTNNRNPLQIGVEIYGHQGIESDLEVIQLMLETLKLSGKNNLHLDLGHIGVIKALFDALNLTPEQASDITEALQSKSTFALPKLTASLNLTPELNRVICTLPKLIGDVDILTEANTMFTAADIDIEHPIEELTKLHSFLTKHYPDIKVYFDLSEFKGYHYHTGLVFAAFTPDYGYPLAQGGRYDNVGQDFGNARPATGFSTALDVLASDQTIDHENKIIYAKFITDESFLLFVNQLRNDGEIVIFDYSDDFKERQYEFTHALVKTNNEWYVQPI